MTEIEVIEQPKEAARLIAELRKQSDTFLQSWMLEHTGRNVEAQDTVNLMKVIVSVASLLHTCKATSEEQFQAYIDLNETAQSLFGVGVDELKPTLPERIQKTNAELRKDKAELTRLRCVVAECLDCSRKLSREKMRGRAPRTGHSI